MEMQVKIAQRYYLSPLRVAKLKKKMTAHSVGKDMGRPAL